MCRQCGRADSAKTFEQLTLKTPLLAARVTGQDLEGSRAHSGLDVSEQEARLAVLPGGLLLVLLRIAAHLSSRSVI